MSHRQAKRLRKLETMYRKHGPDVFDSVKNRHYLSLTLKELHGLSGDKKQKKESDKTLVDYL